MQHAKLVRKYLLVLTNAQSIPLYSHTMYASIYALCTVYLSQGSIGVGVFREEFLSTLKPCLLHLLKVQTGVVSLKALKSMCLKLSLRDDCLTV